MRIVSLITNAVNGTKTPLVRKDVVRSGEAIDQMTLLFIGRYKRELPLFARSRCVHVSLAGLLASGSTITSQVQTYPAFKLIQ